MLRSDEIPEPVERLYERVRDYRESIGQYGSMAAETLALICTLADVPEKQPKKAQKAAA